MVDSELYSRLTVFEDKQGLERGFIKAEFSQEASEPSCFSKGCSKRCVLCFG
jgi:hypothetical protein